jgi:hypothetical protein
MERLGSNVQNRSKVADFALPIQLYFRMAGHPGIEKAFDRLFSHFPERNK